jgi:hypothetical protein
LIYFAGEGARHGWPPWHALFGALAALVGAILGRRTHVRRAAFSLGKQQHLPAMPAGEESIIVAKFESWLSKAGKAAVVAAKNVVANIRPAAEEVQKLEPVADLVLGPYGADFNLVVDAIVSVEQAYAVLAPAGGAGSVKAATVLQLVKETLLPKLVASGMTSEAAEAYLVRYIDAAVLLLNGPLATPSSAQASVSTTEDSTSTTSTDATADTATTDTVAAASSTDSTTAISSDATAEASTVVDATSSTDTSTSTDTTAAAA